MTALPRFLCDEMLGRLCRYLRAAGYDALLANGGRGDAELLRQCLEEGRYLEPISVGFMPRAVCLRDAVQGAGCAV